MPLNNARSHPHLFDEKGLLVINKDFLPLCCLYKMYQVLQKADEVFIKGKRRQYSYLLIVQRHLLQGEML